MPGLGDALMNKPDMVSALTELIKSINYRTLTLFDEKRVVS